MPRAQLKNKVNGTLTHITNATCAFYRAWDANCAIRVINLLSYKAQIHPTGALRRQAGIDDFDG